MCMCLVRGGVGGGVEWMRVLGLGFTNPVGTGGVLDVFLYFGCGGVGGEWVGACTRVWRGGVVLCLCEFRIWILCVDGRSRYLCIVLGGYPEYVNTVGPGARDPLKPVSPTDFPI